jgi:predicted kinase
LGAVCIRSDIERKRLAGVAPTARTDHALGAGLYAPAATRATYARMTEVATAILAAGFIAIVDATLQRRSDRRSLAAAAEGSGGRFALVLCEAPVRTLQQRIAVRRARGDDASDASLPVLARQRVDFESLDAAEASCAWWLDTDTDLDTLAMRCAALAKSIIAYGLRLIQRNARCPQVYTIDSSP